MLHSESLLPGMPLFILLVDHDPDSRDTHAELLKEIGYQCVAVDSVAQALAAVKGLHFDAIFVGSKPSPTDMRRLAQEAKSIQPQLKMVIASAAPPAITSPLVDAFLQKPFELRVLDQILKQVVLKSSVGRHEAMLSIFIKPSKTSLH